MKEPTRLLSGSGPARELMAGSVLRVPSGARQRALQFTGVAVGVTASGTAAAAAGASSLVKSLVITVSLGAVGGGLASLTASEVFSRIDSAKAVVSASAAAPRAPAALAPARPAAAPTANTAPDEAVLPLSAPAMPPPANAAPLGSASSARVPGKSNAVVASGAPPSASVGEFRDVPQRPSLFEEQRVIEAARAAVARGDASGALSTLDGYDHGYAQKQFGPEALALRVQALSASGQQARASTLAREFEQRYPHHPLLSRVQSAVAH